MTNIAIANESVYLLLFKNQIFPPYLFFLRLGFECWFTNFDLCKIWIM